MKTKAGLLKKGLISAMAVALLVACGKKDEGAPPPPPPPVVGPYGGGLLGGGIQFQTDHLQGVLSIAGTTGNMNTSDPNFYIYYVGPVTFSGTVAILDNSYCGAPIQSYPLTGTANYSSGVMSGIQVTAGPIQLFGNKAVLMNSLGTPPEAPPNRMSFVNSQLIVNGQTCGYITTF